MKYELTDEIVECDGRKLHRIRALKDIVTSSYITIKGLGKSYENTTVFTTKNKNIAVKDNDYYYKTLSEFANQMEEIFGDSKYAKEYLVLVELAKIHFGIKEEQ